MCTTEERVDSRQQRPAKVGVDKGGLDGRDSQSGAVQYVSVVFRAVRDVHGA